MSANDLVFGVGHQLDAAGNPIERGIGNMTDRLKAQTAAAVAAPQPTVPEVATPASIPVEGAAAAVEHAAEVVVEKIEAAAAEAEAAIEAEIAKL